MPTPTYINIEYFFYKSFVFLEEAYSFIINLPWTKIHFWAGAIAAIIIILFIAGIVYNLVKISHLKAKEREEL